MRIGTRVMALLVGVVVVTAGAGSARAAGKAAVAKQVERLNEAALVAWNGGDSEKAKSVLLEALVLGKNNRLDDHAALGQSYLYLGVVHVEGLADQDKGVRYLASALRISPNLKVSAALDTPAVQVALAKARALAAAEKAPGNGGDQAGFAPLDGDPAGGAAAGGGAESKAQVAQREKQARLEAERKAQVAERDRQARLEEERTLADLAAVREREAQQRKEEAERRILEAEERKRQAKIEEERTLRALAEEREREAKKREAEAREAERVLQELAKQKEREAIEKARLEREERDRMKRALAQVADQQKRDKAAYERLQQDKLNLEKRLLAEKAELQKRLAEALELLKKQQAETKRVTEEKAKAEKDLAKRLAETEKRESKERVAKEKLEEEKRLAQARQQQLAAFEREQAAERRRLAAGPPLPGSITRPLHCATPDESRLGKDVFVHCAPKPGMNPHEVTLYYRPSGSPHWSSVPMKRSNKGWFTGMVPAAVIEGRMLQYYAKAQAPGGKVVSFAKPTMPNIIMIRQREKPPEPLTKAPPPKGRKSDPVRDGILPASTVTPAP